MFASIPSFYPDEAIELYMHSNRGSNFFHWVVKYRVRLESWLVIPPL